MSQNPKPFIPANTVPYKMLHVALKIPCLKTPSQKHLSQCIEPFLGGSWLLIAAKFIQLTNAVATQWPLPHWSKERGGTTSKSPYCSSSSGSNASIFWSAWPREAFFAFLGHQEVGSVLQFLCAKHYAFMLFEFLICTDLSFSLNQWKYDLKNILEILWLAFIIRYWKTNISCPWDESILW